MSFGSTLAVGFLYTYNMNDWVENLGGIHFAGFVITGLITFIGVWIYAISEWGFLLGVSLGWVPAVIVALVGGYLWPIFLITILILLATDVMYLPVISEFFWSLGF